MNLIPNLEELDISYNKFGDIPKLVNSLKNIPTLRKLILPLKKEK